MQFASAAQQLLDQLVFLGPLLLDPRADALPIRLVADRGAAQNLRRDLALLHTHRHGVDALAKQIPETRRPVRVDDGHVEKGFEVPAHRRQGNAEAADIRFEHVPVRAALPSVLGLREVGCIRRRRARRRASLQPPNGAAGRRWKASLATAWLERPCLGQTMREKRSRSLSLCRARSNAMATARTTYQPVAVTWMAASSISTSSASTKGASCMSSVAK